MRLIVPILLTLALVVADLPLGSGVGAAGFDGTDAPASCGDGTLTVARANASGGWAVAQTVPTAKGQGRPKAKPGTFRVLVVERKAE